MMFEPWFCNFICVGKQGNGIAQRMQIIRGKTWVHPDGSCPGLMCFWSPHGTTAEFVQFEVDLRPFPVGEYEVQCLDKRNSVVGSMGFDIRHNGEFCVNWSRDMAVDSAVIPAVTKVNAANSESAAEQLMAWASYKASSSSKPAAPLAETRFTGLRRRRGIE